MIVKRPIGLFPIAIVALAACSSGDNAKSPTDPIDPPPEELPTTINTETISPSGGTVALKDGTSVVFPAGAVSSPLQVTLKKGQPSTWFDGSGEQQKAVVETTASVTEFAKDVEIRIPLPVGMTPADSSDVLAGVIDETTGAVTVEASHISMIDGKPFLVVETNHFSSRFAEWLFGKDPPSSALLTLPYYSQGSSPYCWATSLEMVTQGANYGDLRSIADIIGAAGIDEGGISAASFRMSSTISGIVKGRTGVKPDRNMFDWVNKSLMRDYLRREIGVNKRPVALFLGKAEHAIVVVGYDGSNFRVHDPASLTTTSVGYTVKPWSDMIDGMAINDKLVTLVVPKDLPATTDRVTVNFLSQAFQFLKPYYGPGEESQLWRYKWDYTRPEGYSIRNVVTDQIGNPIPGEVSTLKVGGEIQLANSSRTASKDVVVYLDVQALGAPSGMGRLSTQQVVTVGPNSTKNLQVPDIPVDTFRYNIIDEPVEYTLSAIVREGGNTLDWQTVKFKIAPVTPVLTSVVSAAAAVGEEVTITGKKLGLMALNNEVSFNGVKADSIVSWDDAEIKVIVPEGATSGPLLVKRGEVESNSLTFTVSEFTTLSGSVNRSWGNDSSLGFLKDANITASGAWSVRGSGLFLQLIEPVTTTYYFQAKLGEPVEVTLNFSGSAGLSELPSSSGGKYVLHPLVWSMGTSNYGSNFPLSETGSGGYRTYSFTLQTLDDGFCGVAKWGISADVYDAEGNLTQSDKYLNGRTAALFCVAPFL